MKLRHRSRGIDPVLCETKNYIQIRQELELTLIEFHI